MEETALIEITSDGDIIKSELIRPEVARFALEMERVLKENDHKSGWDEMSIHQLFSRIKDEFEELQMEYVLWAHTASQIRGKHKEKMCKEAIDISNFCMFLCHSYLGDK